MTRPLAKIAGVCGWPIHHSLSPALHQFWLTKMELKGGYIPFAVHPDEAVRAFKSLKSVSITGLNVTAPLKSFAYEAADVRTKEAQSLGVANCLYKKDGQLVAHNTDVEGFLVPLLNKVGPDFIKRNPAIIFGAGGATRAVIGALIQIGSPEIRICTRRDEQSRDMVAEINIPSLYSVRWDKRQNGLESAGIIINATTAGMHGRSGLDISLTNSRKDALVYDLVYTPIITPLIEQARALGRDNLGGLEMLIGQARPSFERFFGVAPRPEFDPTDLLLRHLNSAHGS